MQFIHISDMIELLIVAHKHNLFRHFVLSVNADLVGCVWIALCAYAAVMEDNASF